MRKYIILPILLISLFCTSIYASDTTTYHITAYKQETKTPGTYSMSIYDTLHGSLEVLGQNTGSEAHKTDRIDLSNILGHFFYNAGEDEVDNFNEHILFAVLSFGTTTIKKDETQSIKLTITITGFKKKDSNQFIPLYLEYGNAETKYSATKRKDGTTIDTKNNKNIVFTPSYDKQGITASNATAASITQTISFRNYTDDAVVSWEDTIAFAMGIKRSDYDAAPIGDYVSNVTVKLEAP